MSVKYMHRDPDGFLITVGDRVHDVNGELRVMALADGWLLVRRPGCVPFAMYHHDWRRLAEAERALRRKGE